MAINETALETIFSIANVCVLPFWALLIFAPKTRWSARVFRWPWAALLLAMFYAVVVIPGVVSDPEILAQLARPTLAGVGNLLGTPLGAAAGWIHFLSFDLFVGIWVWRRAMTEGESFLWVSPILALILMLGPLGWLLYTVVAFFVSRRRFASLAKA
jgi:hypothetical protein